MKINQETAQIVNDWLTKKCKALDCVGCHKRSWDFGDIIKAKSVPTPLRPANGHQPADVVYASLVCRHCGFVALFLVPELNANRSKGSQ